MNSRLSWLLIASLTISFELFSMEYSEHENFASSLYSDELKNKLFNYISNGDISNTKKIIRRLGEGFLLRNHQGKTAFMKAVDAGQKEIATLLLESELSNVKKKAYDVEESYRKTIELLSEKIIYNSIPIVNLKVLLNSILFECVRSKDLEMIKELLFIGINVNAKDYRGDTPLILAIKAQSHEIVKWLIFCGAKVRSKDKFNNDALHYAVELNDAQGVAILLCCAAIDYTDKSKILADIRQQRVINNEIKLMFENYRPHQVLTLRICFFHAIEQHKDLRIIGALLSALGDTNLRTIEQEPVPINLELQRKFLINDTTPLGVAAERNNYDAVRFFIGAGADVNAKNSIGYTPLMQAVTSSGSTADRFAIVKLLVESGANVDERNKHGNTAITIAKYLCLHKIAEYLESMSSAAKENK